MADITVTAAEVAVVYPQQAEMYSVQLTEAVTKGVAGYVLTTGKFGIADANASGKQQFRGIFIEKGSANAVVSLVKRGWLYGYDLSGLNVGAALYLSDTAGALADAAGTMSVQVGRVMAIPLGNGTLQKVAYIEADWLRTWS